MYYDTGSSARQVGDKPLVMGIRVVLGFIKLVNGSRDWYLNGQKRSEEVEVAEWLGKRCWRRIFLRPIRGTPIDTEVEQVLPTIRRRVGRLVQRRGPRGFAQPLL